MPQGKNRQKKIRPILIWVIFITLGVILFVFFSARQFQSSPISDVNEIQREASLSMEGIRMVSTRDGARAWDLTAEAGQYLDNCQQAIFNNISVFFYQKEDGPLTLTADTGIYQSESNDLELSGHVVVKNDQYQMESTQLQYEHKVRTLVSNTPVSVKGKAVDLDAESMAYFLETDEITLKGKITGTISDNIIL
ncbi:MAG: LPS export ABC transporter periplasmic protein LptC [Pseudomonadota bacterium]